MSSAIQARAPEPKLYRAEGPSPGLRGLGLGAWLVLLVGDQPVAR